MIVKIILRPRTRVGRLSLHMLLLVGRYHTLTPYSLLKPDNRLIVGLIYILPNFDEGPVQYDVRKFLFRFVGPALPPNGMNQVHNI